MVHSVYSREEFISFWEKNLVDPAGPMWCYERFSKKKSNHFIKIQPLRISSQHNAFHSWCEGNISGSVICYSSSDTEEWWGFSNYQDILIWCLKWG
jgi:hypothetical protein